MTLRVIGPREKSTGVFVNTTSQADGWSRGLSPFCLGPVEIPYGPTADMLREVRERIERAKPGSKSLETLKEVDAGIRGKLRAWNVENAWQYSKVYPDFDAGEQPKEEWFQWRFSGLQKRHAVRYPMGKWAKPNYSWFDGQRLSYVEARRRIYIPLYANAVRNTDAYRRLQGLYTAGDVTLWDFDGYDHRALGMSLDDVVRCESRKMGHAFVLAMMLEGII